MFALLASLGALGCVGDFADPSRAMGPAVESGPAHPTTIHAPTTLGVVDSDRIDVNGTPIGVACETCHGPSATESWAAREGDDFHTGVEVEHGQLPCDSCHDREDRSLLHLADGRSLAMADAMQLCAQCHGPQFRDYQRGSHGGMSGYWDLARGPRERNHCVDCHAPHAPPVPRVNPLPPPVDRGAHP